MKFKNGISPDSLENLVDLLNKHMKETRKKNEDIGEYLNYAEDGRRIFLYEIDGAYYDINECVILSKRYGFIKRLVENDKIDFEKDKYGIILYENGVQKFLKSEEEILMELSIQESPIEYLISILR